MTAICVLFVYVFHVFARGLCSVFHYCCVLKGFLSFIYD